MNGVKETQRRRRLPTRIEFGVAFVVTVLLWLVLDGVAPLSKTETTIISVLSLIVVTVALRQVLPAILRLARRINRRPSR